MGPGGPLFGQIAWTRCFAGGAARGRPQNRDTGRPQRRGGLFEKGALGFQVRGDARVRTCGWEEGHGGGLSEDRLPLERALGQLSPVVRVESLVAIPVADPG